jgi:serine/threonine-protein kinase
MAGATRSWRPCRKIVTAAAAAYPPEGMASITAWQRSAADPAPGTGLPERLGKYEILRHVATGGMAEIHLARVTGVEGFEKLVVIKRILPQIASNADFVKMFRHEARLASTLRHANIVRVYDIGQANGRYFFAMEFLHGKDLRQIVKAAHAAARPVPLDHALNICIGVCAGLHYAHEKLDFDGRPLNIIHRDVSPQNVLVTFDGGVKLVDFGIAKTSRGASAACWGTLKGKVRYLSPEQCAGESLDRRSDVFAVAVMLWELTTGRRLRCGKHQLQVMREIVTRDAPAPTTVRPGYPAELESIVMQGLRRNRAARYQTAEEFGRDLEAFARECGLVLSAPALAEYMRRLFPSEIDVGPRA